MKLSYRGVSYPKPSANPILDTLETSAVSLSSETERASYPRHMTASGPQIERKYRGVKYSAPDYELQGTLELSPPLNSYQPSAGESKNLGQQHLQNLLANLERRIQAAQGAGNEGLVQALRLEYQTLVCQN
ncbi:MAG: DUF4278 domain-containing protein [Cyanobacteriota bacterium]|jgi:hypothetical protein